MHRPPDTHSRFQCQHFGPSFLHCKLFTPFEPNLLNQKSKRKWQWYGFLWNHLRQTPMPTADGTFPIKLWYLTHWWSLTWNNYQALFISIKEMTQSLDHWTMKEKDIIYFFRSKSFFFFLPPKVICYSNSTFG